MSRLISYKGTKSTGATEPVTLADMKAYLRIDFSDDDDLITSLITSARSKCEKILGMVLIDTDIQAYYEANCNYVYGKPYSKNVFEIFYGPVKGDSGVPAFDGLPNDAEIIGDDTGIWIETYENKLDITYSSGWDEVPEWAVLAIKKQVAWDYESRGDSNVKYVAQVEQKIAPETFAILNPYRTPLNEIIL